MLGFRQSLTAGIRIKLPVAAEWPACKEIREDAGDRCSNDEDKTNDDSNAIRAPEAILSKRVNMHHGATGDFQGSSYRQSNIKCKH